MTSRNYKLTQLDFALPKYYTTKNYNLLKQGLVYIISMISIYLAFTRY